MSHVVGLLLPLLLLPAAPIPADRKFDPEAVAKAVSPFLDEDTIAVIHVDLTRLDADRLHEQLAALARLQPGELKEQKKALADAVKKLTDAGAKDLFVVFSIADFTKQPPFFVVPLDTGADPDALVGLKKTFQALAPEYDTEQIRQAVVAGSDATRQRLKAHKSEPRAEVAEAFAAAGDGVAQVVFVTARSAQNYLAKAQPTLPAELGGGSTLPLLRGLRWATITVQTKPKVKIQCVYQATDKDAAKTVLDMVQKGGKSLFVLKEFQEAFPTADKLAELLTPRLDGDRLTLSFDEPAVGKFLPTLVAQTRLVAARAVAVKDLHQLAIAMHSYHDVYGALPAVANFDKQNKPLLSWRVHLLPYLAEGELYNQFHLDEPWDSEHNKKLIAKMPKVFANPYNAKLAADGKTTYLAPVHKDAIFTGKNQGLSLVQIPDGTSNTVMLVDVDDDAAVAWTKPDDLKLDPKNPTKSLSTRHGDRYLFLFADGHVQAIPKKIDKDMVWAIFTVAGGEVVNLP